MWAVKFTARPPNLLALEISSFKCGHDAPIYGVVEGIIEQSGTPYFCFKDLDEKAGVAGSTPSLAAIFWALKRFSFRDLAAVREAGKL